MLSPSSISETLYKTIIHYQKYVINAVKMLHYLILSGILFEFEMNVSQHVTRENYFRSSVCSDLKGFSKQERFRDILIYLTNSTTLINCHS